MNLSLLASIVIVLSSTPAQTATTPALPARLEDCVQKRAERDDFSGSVLVARQGKPILSKGYGLASREHEVANTPRTKFRIGSVTKPITALLMLLLAQQGKLDLDEPARKHLPDLPEAWDKVTIHHLLSHSGGVPEHTNQLTFPMRMATPTTPTAIIDMVRDRPLDFPAGEKFRYTNTGYILLGMIAEKVTGKRYPDLVRQQVLEPAGMRDSGYDEPGLIVKGKASGYLRRDKETVLAPYIHMSWPFAAGGLYSTTEDLLRLDELLYTDKLLRPDLKQKMFTPVRGEYAYGWAVKLRAGRPSIGHAGGIPGNNSFFLRFPDEHLFVAVLSNTDRSVNVAELATELASLVLGAGP